MCKKKRKFFARLKINQGRTWTKKGFWSLCCWVHCDGSSMPLEFQLLLGYLRPWIWVITFSIYMGFGDSTKYWSWLKGPRNPLVEACLRLHGCWWCPQWVRSLGQGWVTINIEEWQEELELQNWHLFLQDSMENVYNCHTILSVFIKCTYWNSCREILYFLRRAS